MMRTGRPGRSVKVGWMLRLRRVISCPTWFLQTVSPGDDDAIAVLPVFRRGQLGADAQQRGQRRAGKDAIPMPTDAILQAGVAG